MKKLLFAVVIVLGAAIAWWLASPLFLNKEVQEAFPIADTSTSKQEASSSVSVEMRKDEERAIEPSEKIQEKPTASSASQGPVLLASGSFRDEDGFHKGSGNAGIYQSPDNSLTLRLENFTVTNGPDLRVYLVKNTSGDPDGGFLDLGKLKGNIGNQNYVIPAGTDVSAYKSAVIWCRAFGVRFTTAALR